MNNNKDFEMDSENESQPQKDFQFYKQKLQISVKEYLQVEDIIFQDLDDLKKSIQFFNPNITDFELSIYNMAQ